MKRALVQVHLWLGLAVGLVWALQGLTGALLVFHREIDRVLLAPTAAERMTDLAPLAAAVEQDGGTVLRIGILDASRDVLTIDHRDGAGHERTRLFSAATGAELAERDAHPSSPDEGNWARWLYHLHEALLLGDRGETLVGVSGLLLVTALLTGLYVGWPQRRAWRFAADWRQWRTVRAKLFGWHRLAGLIAGAIMLIAVPAGVWMIHAADLRPGLARLVDHQLAFVPPAMPDFERRLSPDQALAAARTRFPDAAFVRVTYPSPKSQAYSIRLRQDGETRAWSGTTTVWVDAQDGRILSVYDPLTAPLSNRLADAAFSIHNGEAAGLLGRILILLTGLALPALYVTGVLAWLRKRQRSAKPVFAAQPAE